MLPRPPRPLREHRVLDDGRTAARFWCRWGRWVLIEAPGRERVEVYREDERRLEMFAGYLDEVERSLRVRLLRAWVRAFVNYREHTPLDRVRLGFRHTR